MKNFLCLLFAPFLFLAAAPPVLLRSFEELPAVFTELNPNRTVVLLDLDDLILYPRSALGSLMWLDVMEEFLLGDGLTQQEANRVRFLIWEYGLLHSTFELANVRSKNILANLQGSGLSILGVTRRSKLSADALISQLNKLGINLFSSLSPFLQLSFFLPAKEPVAIWTQGVLFTGSTPICEACERFVETVSVPLHSVVCISSVREFLDECRLCFSSKKTNNIYVLLALADRPNRIEEDAKFQLLGLRPALTDEDTQVIRAPTPTYSDRDVLNKIREIWNMCSG
ncbi:DUF2608 domain-containing protein [Candidatus Similichlamydia epinepheli]|uniref:DUF2608 domain-containing protein n=1 Tax=Candidatus Similichlamydia epinepheli TaxID=1903953 RepID=UPI000D33F039|nr:DUF2608 domain-containing protein [Candidatus Similichlamydia epinepheli]